VNFHLDAGKGPVTGLNRSLDRKISAGSIGSVAPVRHPDKLTLEPLPAAIGVAVS
jgi:hypothetical protein